MHPAHAAMRACEMRRQEMLAEAARDRLATEALETAPAVPRPRQARGLLRQILTTIAKAMLPEPRVSARLWPFIAGRTRLWRRTWS